MISLIDSLIDQTLPAVGSKPDIGRALPQIPLISITTTSDQPHSSNPATAWPASTHDNDHYSDIHGIPLARDAQAKLALIVAQCPSIHPSICVSHCLSATA